MAALPPDDQPWKTVMSEVWNELNMPGEGGHPTGDVLAAYAEGNLGTGEQEKCEDHLSRCPDCLVVVRGLWDQQKPGQPNSILPPARGRGVFYLAVASLLLGLIGTAWGIRETWIGNRREDENARLNIRLAEAQTQLAFARRDSFFAAHPSGLRAYWVGHGSAKTLQLPLVRGNRPMTPEATAEYAQTKKAFEELVEFPERRGKALLDLAFLCAAAGQQKDAERYLAEAEKTLGNSPEVRNGRAVLLLGKGDKEATCQAFDILQGLTRTQPDYLPGWFNLALVYGRLFRDDDARRTWGEYLRRETRAEYLRIAEAHMADLK